MSSLKAPHQHPMVRVTPPLPQPVAPANARCGRTQRKGEPPDGNQRPGRHPASPAAKCLFCQQRQGVTGRGPRFAHRAN